MFETFEDFIANTSTRIPIITFIFNFCITGLLTIPLSWAYINYGGSLSNRRTFSKNFILLSMTTMLIISIVKSSLALSLGLVGALSIIRFRAAIKEPEELAYLFIAIAILDILLSSSIFFIGVYTLINLHRCLYFIGIYTLINSI